jgi:hypothetical protein
MIYAIVMLIVLPAAAFAFGLCRAAAKPTPKIPTIGRRSYAEGRPTMPSTPEPEDERARRRAPRRCLDLSECECWEPTLRDTGEVDPPSLR